MGITLKDIHNQREMLRRGEEIARAAEQAAERERLRDTFAAAALTGLLTNGDYSVESVPSMAWRMADAMLRERSRAGQKIAECDSSRAVCPERDSSTNNDAATGEPGGSVGFSSGSRSGQINRTPERESPRRECGESSLRDVPQDDKSRAAGGPEHFSYPKSDENRVFSDAIRDTPPRKGTPADCSVGVSQTAIEPVAWAALHDDGDIAWIGYTPDGAADGACGRQIVPLYRSPTLTDAEREAIKIARDAYADDDGNAECEEIAAVLSGLLERTKGGER